MSTALPFGRHAGQPLEQVPASYLGWLLANAKLSSGLRAAVAGELARRGLTPPEPPPPRSIRPCQRCQEKGLPDAGYTCHWLEDTRGNRRIRAVRQRCDSFLTFPPSREPYTSMADQAASSTDLLDVLVQLEQLNLTLQSDGKRVWLRWEDEHRVSQDLRGLIRSCSYRLAQLMGKTRPAPSRSA